MPDVHSHIIFGIIFHRQLNSKLFKYSILKKWIPFLHLYSIIDLILCVNQNKIIDFDQYGKWSLTNDLLLVHSFCTISINSKCQVVLVFVDQT